MLNLITMCREEILKLVQQIIVDQLGTQRFQKPEDVNVELHLKDDLFVDSLDMCMILVAIEDKLNIDFTLDEQDKIMDNPTVGIIVDVVCNMVSKKEESCKQ